MGEGIRGAESAKSTFIYLNLLIINDKITLVKFNYFCTEICSHAQLLP